MTSPVTLPDLTPFIEAGTRDLATLVALESVSAQGRMLPETADAVTRMLEQEGFSVQCFPGQVAPILLAEAGEGPRKDVGFQSAREPTHQNVQDEKIQHRDN